MDFQGIFFDTKDFKLLKRHRLGKGAFGIVYLAENKQDHQLYAAKIIDVEDNFDGNDQMQIMRESSILSKLNHIAVVKFIGVNFRSFEDSAILQPAIITEYIKNGSLKAILDQEKEGTVDHEWTPSKKYICLLGICSAMKYLHLKGVLHRDLKPENVLIDDEYFPKVCDFGLSRCFPESLSKSMNLAVTGQIGTPLYMAPELLDDEEKYGTGVDVYAFSILAYEIVAGKQPFYELGKDLNAITLRQKVLNGDRPSLSDDIPENMQKLLQRCWSQNPNERPSFDEIFQLLSSDFSYSPEDVDEDEVNNYLEMIDDSLEKEENKSNKINDKIFNDCLEISRRKLEKASDLIDIFASACEEGNIEIVEYFITNKLIDINTIIVL